MMSGCGTKPHQPSNLPPSDNSDNNQPEINNIPVTQEYLEDFNFKNKSRILRANRYWSTADEQLESLPIEHSDLVWESMEASGEISEDMAGVESEWVIGESIEPVFPTSPKKVVWNIGALPHEQPFEGEYIGTRLERNTEYDIHLSLGFPKENVASDHRAPSSAFHEIVCNNTEDLINMWAILVPADEFFDIEKDASIQPLEVNAAELRKSYCQSERDTRSIDFASAVFSLRTKGKYGEGTLSVYLYYKGRNIDIIDAWFGVGEDREHQLREQEKPLAAFNSVNATEVDASLSIYQFASGSKENYIRALFFIDGKEGGSPDYWTWRIKPNGSADKSLDRMFRKISINETLAKNGLKRNSKNLIKELFRYPYDGDKQKAYEAMKYFACFLKDSHAIENKKPSLYVNMRYADSKHLYPNYFLPLRMLWVPTNYSCNDKNFFYHIDDNEPGFFVGHQFDIFYPFQNNTTNNKNIGCIDTWTALIPPDNVDDSVLKKALEEKPIEEAWKKATGNYTVFFDPYEFVDTLDDADWDKNQPVSVFILGHHHEGEIYFSKDQCDTNENCITANSFVELPSHSLVVLNACDTFQPSLVNDIGRNDGVDTVIATTSPIDARVAIEFFRCLQNYMKQQHIETATRKLYDIMRDCMNPTEYVGIFENKDLSYIIIGNENIKLCSPWTN